LPVAFHAGDDEDDESKPSTSASSPSPDLSVSGDIFITRAVPVEGTSRFQTNKTTEQHAIIVSAWEKIAADISRIPKMVELDDLSGSAREWRRRVEEEEARRVGESVEAMIFEELRWEAVRDMLCLCCCYCSPEQTSCTLPSPFLKP
jgi:hypothetical protein